MKKKVSVQKPTIEEIEAELKRERKKRRRRSVLKSTICTLIVVAFIAVLVWALYFSTLDISGGLYFFLYNPSM